MILNVESIKYPVESTCREPFHRFKLSPNLGLVLGVLKNFNLLMIFFC